MNNLSLKKPLKRISFIIPAMNEEETIEVLYHGIQKNLQGVDCSWEVIFIDDGSTDGSWKKMKELAMKSSLHVKAYRFASNRGKADALALGYQVATGDIVFTMDADLQDDPQEIPRFIEAVEAGNDIVTGWKRKRFDPWHKVLPSRVFNAILSKVTGVNLHDHNCGYKAYKKKVVKSIPMYGDMHRMVPSLASFKGFKTTEIEVAHHPREHGVSKYGWSRLIIGALDTLTVGFLQRYRNCPMHFAGKMAAGLTMIALGLFTSAIISAAMGAAAGVLVILGAISVLCAVLVTMQGLMAENHVYRDMEKGRDVMVSEMINSDVTHPSLRIAQYEAPNRQVMAAS